jgi:hypothetical protein
VSYNTRPPANPAPVQPVAYQNPYAQYAAYGNPYAAYANPYYASPMMGYGYTPGYAPMAPANSVPSYWYGGR